MTVSSMIFNGLSRHIRITLLSLFPQNFNADIQPSTHNFLIRNALFSNRQAGKRPTLPAQACLIREMGGEGGKNGEKEVETEYRIIVL